MNLQVSRPGGVLVGLLVAAGLYSSSFLFPACDFTGPVTAWEAFTTPPAVLWRYSVESVAQVLNGDRGPLPVGISGAAALWYAVAWLPNPLSWLAVAALLLRRWRLALAASVLALLAALVFFCFWAGELSFRSGFYLWLASLGAVACTSIRASPWRSDDQGSRP